MGGTGHNSAGDLRLHGSAKQQHGCSGDEHHFLRGHYGSPFVSFARWPALISPLARALDPPNASENRGAAGQQQRKDRGCQHSHHSRTSLLVFFHNFFGLSGCSRSWITLNDRLASTDNALNRCFIHKPIIIILRVMSIIERLHSFFHGDDLL